ncbi:MAG: nucleotidyl transferase AbiEii/AbiGii toxin family protein [Propionibacteriaceae bacterium]
MSEKSYNSPSAMEQAIKAAAHKTASTNPQLQVYALIQQEYFTRFLSRIFITDDYWMLKGGASLLARIPTARTTSDLDLFLQGSTLDTALAELRSAATRDLGDHFRFVYRTHRNIIEGDLQPYATGYRVTFDVLIGANQRGNIGVDLVTKGLTVGTPEFQLPVNMLDLPHTPNLRYRLYPLVDQIADKVCATLEVHNGRHSSREKDLVDLVLIATTQNIDGALLQRAIHNEAQMRRLELPETMLIPKSWGKVFNTLTKKVTQIEEYNIQDAKELMIRFIDPALQTKISGMTWNYIESCWN